MIFAQRCPRNVKVWAPVGQLFNTPSNTVEELRMNLFKMLYLVKGYLEKVQDGRSPYERPRDVSAYTQLYNELRNCIRILGDSSDGVRNISLSRY